MRSTELLFAAALIVLLTAGAQRPPEATPAVPSLVLRASVAFNTATRGLVGMQRHFATVLRAGPLGHEEHSDSGQLMQDGRSVKIAYYRVVRDGRAFSPEEIKQRTDDANEDWAAGKVFFKEPYDPRYLSDYSFGELPEACAACPLGTRAVTFTSVVHDAQHGSGVMYVDTTSAHVVKLTYTPYVLPPHASSGSVTETGGWALPDLWYVVHIDATYRGQAFVIGGMGTFTGVFDHFRRFASLTVSEAALQNDAF